MNKEDLYPLIGKYLNGYKIIKIEEDPFIKGQINLWTDEWITEYFGDKSIVKFFIRPESNSSKTYNELINKEIYQLKDNWNKLKEDLKLILDYSFGEDASSWDKIYGEHAKATLKFMEELEQGSDDSNGRMEKR